MNTRFFRGGLLLALILALGQLQAQPSILQQPLSLLNQILGDSVSLCVSAQSPASTNLQYQWLRNGVRVPGATNSCLAINGIQAIDCGAFSVLVSDGVGVAVSEPAEVTVDLSILQALDGLIDALDLINTSGVIRSYNTGAVKQPGTPEIIPGDPGGSEVWFKWSVPLLQSSGIVTFSTLGSDFDTTMAAYTGSEPTGLTPVPSAINDDDTAGYLNSQVSFYAVAGTTYLIAVDGFYGAQGDLVLSWQLYPNSAKLPSATNMPQSIVASNGASVTLNSPWPKNSCDWLFNGAVIATNKSTLTLTNLNTATVGAYVARYTTSDGISLSAEPVQVQINTLQDGSTATNSTAWVKFLDSANSAFVTPLPGKSEVKKLGGGGDTGGYSCSQTFCTSHNSDEPGEPVICGQNGGHPGWYSYVAPASGALLVSTAGSTFNTILGVFIGSGSSFTTLTNVGCGYTTNYQLYGQPSVYVPVTAGQTNYIVVEGENGASGTVQLNIDFGLPAAILSAPQSQSAGPGTNVSLSVSVSGTGPISYVWQFNGTNIAGATNNTLAISNMQPSAAGAYTVMVSNSVSVVSTQTVLSYVAPAVILSAPLSQSAGPGTNVNLGVSVGGTGPIDYTWQFNGTNLVGATNGTLTISNMQSFNAGTYTVVVSNSISSATTQAVVSYVAPPRISSQPVSKSVNPNADVVLNVNATGSPAPVYQWYVNGVPAPGIGNNVLSIPGFQLANQGTYTVVISNAAGVVTSAPAVLLLDVPPAFTSIGVNNGAFSLQISGAIGTNYVIEGSTDLINWIPLYTNTALTGTLNFTDPNAGTTINRFYRGITNSQ